MLQKTLAIILSNAYTDGYGAIQIQSISRPKTFFAFVDSLKSQQIKMTNFKIWNNVYQSFC